MKIAKVMQMMKANKRVTFFQREERLAGETMRRGPQWVTDRCAAYCLAGAPRIGSEEEFFTAYDVKEKLRDRFVVEFRDLPHYIRDIQRWEGGVTARANEVSVGFRRYSIRGFSMEGEDNMLLVQDKYLAPFVGEEDDYLEYTIRQTEDGKRFLCVFDGLEPRAVIFPMQFGGDWADELRQGLTAPENRRRHDEGGSEEADGLLPGV